MLRKSRGYLLYNRASYITGRAIAEVLNLIPIRDPQHAFRVGLRDLPPAVRYGNSEGRFLNDTNFNSPEVIKLCADSLAFSRWCEKNGVYSPVYEHFNMKTPPQFPFLLRDRWHHGGLDINIIDGRRDLIVLPWNKLEDRYVVKVIPTKFELRVHVVDGHVVKVFVKMPTDDVREGDYIRSHYRGWRYVLGDMQNKYKKAQDLAEEVCAKIGIKFAGIDMAWDSNRGEYVIWEINTAPGLNTNTLLEYTKIIRGKLHV